ncbi:MAG TPA: nitroreductase [Ilumatobacteraceae bacterium]|nr:nitroreductase [Ilumatobacteraceae bacterium]
MTLDDHPNDSDGGFAKLARSRRTSMVVDKELPVARAIVEELCELAQWAPNHKRTWPWRFAIADGDGRSRLGHTIADAMQAHGDPPEKIAKARTKYLRTPSVLVVGSATGESPVRTGENRDAVAAGVQNILLSATSIGLASFWGSCPRGANTAVAELCGFAPDTHISALIYLGWATEAAVAPDRPPVTLNVV